VTAATLNVRSEALGVRERDRAGQESEKLGCSRPVIQWHRVRLASGAVGFVSVDHVIREGAGRRGCPADAEYAFVKTPTPDLREGAAHGIVTVDASVDPHGNVTSTKIVGNTTGDDSLGALAEKEIRSAKFTAPIRNCVAKAFIFTYKRSF
jgi:TonB family protein